MKNLLSLIPVLIITILLTSCTDVQETITGNKGDTKDNVQPVFNLDMYVIQNGYYQSSFIYTGGISFSYPMYGCSSDEPFYSQKGQSTFEVTCTYSWQNNTATYIAGDFEIFNTTDNFSWHKYIFCNGNSSGSITQIFTDANLQPGKTYYARLCNGYFDDDGNFLEYK